MKTITKLQQVKTPAQKNKLRVAAYCRVSTGSDAQLESLDTQKTYFENYINSRSDWELAGIYFDEGITGTKKEKRTALLQLMSDCENHKIDMVITKSLSRFSRNTTDCLELVRRLLAVNVPIFFEKENLNTGSMESELMLAILSSMAEGESTSTSENTKWAVQKRFQNGTFKISYPPYGYNWDGEEMKVNPAQADVVKHIFSSFLSGTGIQDIAKDLNTRQVPTKKGGQWSHGTIKGILTNEKYTGDTIFQKTYTDAQFNRHQNNGQKDQYFCAEHHEAIISHEDFELASHLLEQHSIEKGIVKGSDRYQQRYAFSGNIICGECGATFRRRIHTCKGHKYAAWLCNTHLTDVNVCSMLYIRNDDLEHAFLTMMNKLIFSRKVLLAPLLEQLKNTNEDDGIRRIRELERQLLQISEQRQTLQRLMAQDYLDQIIFTQQKNELMMQTEACKTEIEMLQNNSGQVSTRIVELQKLLHFTEHADMLQAFEEELFTEYADRIIVYSREEVGFELKCGLILRERM